MQFSQKPMKILLGGEKRKANGHRKQCILYEICVERTREAKLMVRVIDDVGKADHSNSSFKFG